MRTKRKLHSRDGFTLAESLIAILILLMMSAIVAAGIPMAKRAYDKITVSANAQVLLSTTITVLRDELGTAQEVVVDTNNNTVTYYDSNNSSFSMISKNDTQGVMLEQNIGVYLTGTGARPIVSTERATKNMYVKYQSVTPQMNLENKVKSVTFNNIEVVWPGASVGSTSTVANLPSLTVRVISAS